MINDILLSKNGLATKAIAKEFIKINLGDKVPTVSEFCELFSFPRGTVQKAIKTLQECEAIRLESKGHLGSYLIRKNMKILLEVSDIDSIVGSMPLPYSKRYEGLASGLIVALENAYNIPISMAYMRGAEARISMVVCQRYDFAVVSALAADHFMRKYGEIDIILSLGKYSYVSNHVIMFHDKNAKEIVDGMKVGIDQQSLDQKTMTMKICKGIKVSYVQLEYTQIIAKILNGEIDAAVMNVDEVKDKNIDINYVTLDCYEKQDTEAVLVGLKRRKELFVLLREIIDVNTVINIQNLVMDGKITPSY